MGCHQRLCDEMRVNVRNAIIKDRQCCFQHEGVFDEHADRYVVIVVYGRCTYLCLFQYRNNTAKRFQMLRKINGKCVRKAGRFISEFYNFSKITNVCSRNCLLKIISQKPSGDFRCRYQVVHMNNLKDICVTIFRSSSVICCGLVGKPTTRQPEYSGEQSFPLQIGELLAVQGANQKGDNGNAANDNGVQPIAVFFNHLISPKISVPRHFSLFITGRSSCLKGVAYV